VSVPINPDKVMDFTKEIAISENVKVSKYRFLDKKKAIPNEAKKLLVQAFDFKPNIEDTTVKKEKREYLTPEESVPEQFFPPCIQNILKGITDGRKRSLFILSNFLTSVGWGYDQIEKRLDEWNKQNTEPLREVLIQGQVRYHKQKNKKILPPNCGNKMYYHDLRFCIPDNLCQKIKNPVNYSRIKTRYLNKEKKPKKEVKTTNKEMNKEQIKQSETK
ncbi:MAG: hypothetical protein KJ561_03425, partial [Nanoarchaeota archaeon]|nr:hypothetical protein [Nanoarchaeota archaeon]